jgi:hypothetical protein
MAMCLAMFLLWPHGYNTAEAVALAAKPNKAAAAAATAPAYRVPVTLYVMSRCPGGFRGRDDGRRLDRADGRTHDAGTLPRPPPSHTHIHTTHHGNAPNKHTDAKFCEQALKPVLEALPGLMSLRTQYLATLTGADAVSCMHGERECEGNKQQLCLQAAAAEAGLADSRAFLEALLCHGKGDVGSAEHLQKCMTDAGIKAPVQAKALACVGGTQGAQLQVASAKEVAANEVKKSCTVFIEGTKRCIRDGGTWYDCPRGSDSASFIAQICEAHKAKTGVVAPECGAALGGAEAAAAAAADKAQ